MLLVQVFYLYFKKKMTFLQKELWINFAFSQKVSSKEWLFLIRIFIAGQNIARVVNFLLK